MKDFNDLKQECKNKLEEVQLVYKKKVKRLVEHELAVEAERCATRIAKEQDRYILDGKISMYVDINGNLDIIDNRGTAFGWLFEICFDEKLIIGDIFSHNGNIYSVQYLKRDEFEDTTDEIKKVISNVDDTMVKLEQAPDILEWSHIYYDDHEEVKCNTISDVIRTVINREPVVR